MIPSAANHHPAAANWVVAGLGCRRGCSAQELSSLLLDSLQAHGVPLDNLVGLASIAHKRDEPGLQVLAEQLGVPLSFFSAEQLLPYVQRVQGSDHVQAITGSPAVAEPCALALAEALGGAAARLLDGKTRNASATCALALIDRKDLP